MKTLDQIRAEYAWACVQGVDEKYKNLAKGLPALVMSNGLMQTLAFLQGKAGKKEDKNREINEHEKLLGHLLDWLGRPEAHVLRAKDSENFANAMKALSGCDSLLYQRATEEALAVLKWIRYLANAVA
ncbi:type III-B CRISPR module-associated protein Cmr5 [Desulfosoma caldarium]|uniref:CRISPR type III-B/RAMP module-associated protein Cmr5 n=1 Tax=Desulfosoma caldarium TaxID=610254 RepID=A0A3N1ULF7_9BACT|nr:type III-B CRISPR module-associated protein Cmr5 [Desulfosoma caldarium]ROQ92064.1 CRISPR-associated Cmr5 family protein [Desulfosoma caldarium]